MLKELLIVEKSSVGFIVAEFCRMCFVWTVIV